MTPILRHVRGLWPGPGIWLPAPFVLWAAGCLAAGERRWELFAFLVGVPALAYANAWSKKLFLGLLPLGLLGLVYDSMRFVKTVGVTPGRVHLCDLRAIDARLAGVDLDGARVSLPDWFHAHPNAALDFVCAIPYGTFIFVAVGFSVFLYVKDYARMRLFGWTFFLMNVAGFFTYHLYPAAPPWYFHAHGCAVDLASRASSGPALARVDEWLGFRYFAGFYGRSNDVFGAMPSLHVAYPMMIVLYGWPLFGVAGRALATLFLASMCFAAVYLDHHWVIDVILGLTYAIATACVVRAFVRRRRGPKPSVASAPLPEARP